MFRNANWIWTDISQDEKDQHVNFRKTIKLSKPVDRIEICISASDYYKLVVNGDQIGLGPCPATPEFYYFDRYAVDCSRIKEVLCLAVSTYCIGVNTQMVTNQNQGMPALIMKAVITYTDHSVQTVCSDESFKAIVPPEYFRDYIKYDEARISRWGGFKEVFLSNRQHGDFTAVDFDDSEWGNSVIVTKAKYKFGELLEREIPYLLHEQVFPRSVLQIEPYLGRILQPENCLSNSGDATLIDASLPQSFPSIVLDFGRESVGYLTFDLQGSNGASMRISYGESLDMMQMDTLILNGKRQKYTPYQRRAFRYVKLTFNNSPKLIELYSIILDSVRYPFILKSSFECSDSTINKIFDTSIYTTMLNSQEHFEDCPLREKMQWLADSRVMSLVGYWCFGDERLSKKAIKQFFRIQHEDGKIPASGPQAMDGPTVDFCEHFVFMLYEYYFYTGDLSIISEHYSQIERLMQKFESIEDENGLLDLSYDPSWGVFIDWASIDKREKVAALNCFYARVLELFGIMSKLVGENVKLDYLEKAKLLKAQIYETFFCKEKGLFYDCVTEQGPSTAFSQQTNIIAILSGVVPLEEIKEMLSKIFSYTDIETIKGAFLLSFAVETLFQNQYEEKAFSLLRDFWGEMLERGATTWWETFDLTTQKTDIPDLFSQNSATSYIQYIPNSHCHGWGAGPAFLLPRYILGVHPVDVGFSKIHFKPYTDGLSYAKGSINTPYGDIIVSWEKGQDNTIQYQLILPKGIERVEDYEVSK